MSNATDLQGTCLVVDGGYSVDFLICTQDKKLTTSDQYSESKSTSSPSHTSSSVWKIKDYRETSGKCLDFNCMLTTMNVKDNGYSQINSVQVVGRASGTRFLLLGSVEVISRPRDYLKVDVTAPGGRLPPNFVARMAEIDWGSLPGTLYQITHRELSHLSPRRYKFGGTYRSTVIYICDFVVWLRQTRCINHFRTVISGQWWTAHL